MTQDWAVGLAVTCSPSRACPTSAAAGARQRAGVLGKHHSGFRGNQRSPGGLLQSPAAGVRVGIREAPCGIRPGPATDPTEPQNTPGGARAERRPTTVHQQDTRRRRCPGHAEGAPVQTGPGPAAPGPPGHRPLTLSHVGSWPWCLSFTTPPRSRHTITPAASGKDRTRPELSPHATVPWPRHLAAHPALTSPPPSWSAALAQVVPAPAT